jgi:hypothetical protein
MTEREIRTVLQRVREELERRARQLVVPSLIGAGLALSSCAPDINLPYGVPDDWRVRLEQQITDTPVYGLPDRGPWLDMRRDKIAPKDVKPDAIAPKPDAVYGVPDVKKDTIAPKDTRLDTVTPREGGATDGGSTTDAGPSKG